MGQDVSVPLIGPKVATLNVQDDPALLSEYEVQGLENFALDNGLLRVRKANKSARTHPTATHTGQALRSVVLNDVPYLVYVAGGEVWYSTNPDADTPTWNRVRMGTDPNYTYPTLSSTLPVSIEGTGSLVIFQDGVNAPVWWDGTSFGTIEHVLPPRVGKECQVTRSWSMEWAPCVSTAGRDANPSDPDYLSPHYYLNEWYWSDATSWTTVTAGGGVTVTVTDAKTVRITESGKGPIHATNFPVGTLIGIKTSSRYIRAWVVGVTSDTDNCYITVLDNFFDSHFLSYPQSATYIRRKGLGGPLANSGAFCFVPRPWDWTMVGEQVRIANGSNNREFRTMQNIASLLSVNLYIRVTATKSVETNQFYGHVVSASWDGTWTTVTLLEPSVPTFGTGTWYGKIEERASGSVGTYSALEMVLTSAATAGQTLEVYLGLDGLANGSQDHTLDLSKTYQLAWNVLRAGFKDVSTYVKLSIGEANGGEIEFTSFEEVENWLYVGLQRKQSDFSVIEETARDAIAYIRFTVVEPPKGDVGTVRMPLYGFRATGNIPGDAEYAFRLTRHGASDSVVLSRSRYVQVSEIAIDTHPALEFLRPPEASPDLYYQFRLSLKRRSSGDGMQVFRRDSPLADFRMTSVLNEQTVYENGIPPSVLAAYPKSFYDVLAAEDLLAKPRIGSATEMAMPVAKVMFQHQGRMVCADVLEPVEGESGFSTVRQPLRVYFSAQGEPLRFDTQTSIGDDADVKDPIFLSLSSNLPGDWVVTGQSVAGGGTGRAVLATTTRVFVVTGSHTGDFALESVGEMGCFGRRAMCAHKGVAYFVGSDRQLWAVGLAMQKIAAPKVEALLSNPYLADAYSRGIAVAAGDNKLWVSVRSGVDTGYCLYGDMRPTYGGEEIAWAMEPDGSRWYECFEQAYPRYDNLSQVWAIEKSFSGGAAVATQVVRLHTLSSASQTLPAKVVSRQMWSFENVMLARKLYLICSTQQVARTITVKVFCDKHPNGITYTFAVPTGSGLPSGDRVDIVQALAQETGSSPKQLVGKTFWVEVSSTALEPLWKLYGVELVLTPVAMPERTRNVAGTKV